MLRKKWTLAGIAMASATAAASPNVPFDTVFDSSSTFYGGGSLLGASQVIVDNVLAGGIFTDAILNNGDSVIIHSHGTVVPGVWSSQDIVDPGTVVAGVNGSITTIDNLALGSGVPANTRLFFAAANNQSKYGVLQLDIVSGQVTVSDVAFDGDGGPYSFSGPNSVISPDGTISLVNDGARVLFPANTTASSGVLVSGIASSVSPFFTPSSSLALTGSTLRFGYSTAPTALAELTASSGGTGVYVLSKSTPLKISGSLAPAQSGAPMVMGYTNDAITAALMLGQGTGGGTTQDVVLSTNNGAPVPILAGGNTSITPGAGVSALGELSPQGKIALYVPDGSGDNADTIQYADATAATPRASIVAAVDTDSSAPAFTKVALSGGTALPIVGLQFGGSSWVPQINDVGAMIFNAEVFDPSLGSDEQALLEWGPARAGSSPIVLLETGTPVDLNGSPSPSLLEGYELSGLVQQNDFYKNAINAGYVGLSINYQDGTNAVVITQLLPSVPEPSTLLLLPVASLGIMIRRRPK
jgi:hypothetical protein